MKRVLTTAFLMVAFSGISHAQVATARPPQPAPVLKVTVVEDESAEINVAQGTVVRIKGNAMAGSTYLPLFYNDKQVKFLRKVETKNVDAQGQQFIGVFPIEYEFQIFATTRLVIKAQLPTGYTKEQIFDFTVN